MLKKKSTTTLLWVAGALAGASAILLTHLGNPHNMGFCIACFLRDTAGALKLHTAAPVQYARPEIAGVLLGSLLIACLTREFRPRGGSAPLTRLVIGAFVMIGALGFLGCPFRMVLRMAGGDLNAWIGLIGFVGGVALGCVFLKKGFSLKRSHEQCASEGLALPAVAVFLMIAVATGSSLLAASKTGPGSMHAPFLWSFLLAAVVGIAVERSRLCQAGAFRDVILLRDAHLLWGTVAMFIIALIGNIALGTFHLSLSGQPVAHSDTLWNILGLGLAGFGSTLLGGCPLRQLVLTGTGNSDSALTVIGLVIGAAMSHNLGLAGVPATATSPGGVGTRGRLAIVIGFVVLIIIAVINLRRTRANNTSASLSRDKVS